MGEILGIFNYFWGISNNKAISIDIITMILLFLAFWKFKIIRHPRYRFRIILIIAIVLLNVNIYLFQITNFEEWHTYCFAIELLTIIYITVSAYKPVLTFFPMKRLKFLVRGGYRKKCDLYFSFLKFITFKTASKLEYKRLITDYYANQYRYIDAYNEFYYLNQKRLFDSEKNEIEVYMAYYATLLGNIKLARTHISKIKEKTPLSLLVEMKICDVRDGKIEEIIKYIDEVENIMQPQTSDGIKAQIYAIYSNCRMIQGNYEDALFNAEKALDFAKKSKNKIIIYGIYEQIILLMCSKNPIKDNIDDYYQEYLECLSLNEPSTVIRAYNFISKYFRLRNMENKLLPLVENNYSSVIINLEGCERYNWEVSNLNVAQHAGLPIRNIMYDVIVDFPNYKSVNMPDRFYLMKNLYGVLDHFFANNSDNTKCELYVDIFMDCECYIAEEAYNDLKQYYKTLDLKQIYERCDALSSMVAISAMSEWHNKLCIIRYDKLIGNAYSYENTDIIINDSKHNERIKMLEDIADIFSTSGLYSQSIDAYINIIEECYSVYWLKDDSKLEMDIIDRVNMEKYVDILIREIQKSSNFRRFQPQYIKLSAQLCVLKKFDKAIFFYNLFDKRELKNFNKYTINYYQFADAILKSYGYN